MPWTLTEKSSLETSSEHLTKKDEEMKIQPENLREVEPTIEMMNIADPEAVAMLQAFYSRSPMSIRERLTEMDAVELLDAPALNESYQNLKDKLNTYYVGYGHKSIGELGEIVIFVENISFIAAKALQHHPLYKGQEVSTRYVDFTNQPIPKISLLLGEYHAYSVDYEKTFKTEVAKSLNKYVTLKEETYSELVKTRGEPKSPTEIRTYQAASFDESRNLLPRVMATSLAWKTDFSNAREHLMRMAGCDFPEVQNLALLISKKLTERYPYACGSHVASSGSMRASLHQDVKARIDSGFVDPWWEVHHHSELDTMSDPYLIRLPELLEFKPSTPYRDYYHLTGSLAFGEWRDLARHRNGMTMWPLSLGVEDAFFHSHPLFEYSRTLGGQVPVSMVMDAVQLEYLMNLRTQKTVHNDLRLFLQEAFYSYTQEVEHIQKNAEAEGQRAQRILSRMDMSKSNWTLKRGTQTILKKEDDNK